jgi:hypothetical protein
MDLLSHVAQEHSENIKQSEGGISEDSVKVNVSKSVKQKVQLKKAAKKNKSVKKIM